MSAAATRPWRERYAEAQAALSAADAVANGAVFPHWLSCDSFWYRRRGEDGFEYRLVDAASGAGRVVLTNAAILAALADGGSARSGNGDPMVSDLELDPAGGAARFTALGRRWSLDLADGSLADAGAQSPPSTPSPDGRSAAFLRGDDLWLRDLGSGSERSLTDDGEEWFAYARKPIATRWLGVDPRLGPPEAVWSADSRWLFTVQVDERRVGESPLVEYAPPGGGRARLHFNRVSRPGDEHIPSFRLVAIEVESGRQVEPDYRALSATRMYDTPFSAGLAWWGDDSTAYFVDVERGDRAAHVVAFDVATGATSVLFSEHADAYLDLSVNVYAPALCRPLPRSEELVWYSERSGNGHLYLYDLESGDLARELTSGSWRVRDVLHVDEERREVLLMAAGMEAGEDPYLCRPARVSLDGGPLEVLSPEAGEHVVWRPGDFALYPLAERGEDRRTVAGVAPDGGHFVETVGAVDRLPVTVLRDRDGGEVAVLEAAEDRGLPGGWTWPEPVALTAADGVTETHGLLFRPPGWEPTASYPLIDLVYGGPQLSHVPKAAFAHGGLGSDVPYLEAVHLAALGAFVLILDGRGTPHRGRAFHQASHGALQTTSNLEDHVAGIQQLASREPSLDLERVGVTGFSAGGYLTALAALRFGDLFRVAVAAAGNYDPGLFWQSYGERYAGDFEPAAYEVQAARSYAAGLKGKLLLIHGLMDGACEPTAMLRLVQALIEENKDFDLVLLPRDGHRWSGYALRRRLDYFVTHLFGETPPSGAVIAAPSA